MAIFKALRGEICQPLLGCGSVQPGRVTAELVLLIMTGEALDESPHSHGGLSEFSKAKAWLMTRATTSLQDPYCSGHGTIQCHFLAFASESSHMPFPVSKMMMSFFFCGKPYIFNPLKLSAEASGAWGVEIGMFLMSISGY